MIVTMTAWERFFTSSFIQSMPRSTTTVNDVRMGIRLLDALEFSEAERTELGITEVPGELGVMRMPIAVTNRQFSLTLNDDAVRWVLARLLAPNAPGMSMERKMLILYDKFGTWEKELSQTATSD